MAEVISFDGIRQRYAAKVASPKSAEGKGNRGRFADNQHTRRALLKMLVYGGTLRGVARKHPGREEGLAQDIREALLDRGMAA